MNRWDDPDDDRPTTRSQLLTMLVLALLAGVGLWVFIVVTLVLLAEKMG